MKLPDMPKGTDWIIYSACVPNWAPRCIIWSDDRSITVSRTGKTVEEAVDRAITEFESKAR